MATEVDEVIKHYRSSKNFLLVGGAGSGKTYSLVKSVESILHESPTAKIACITYTNIGVDEMKSRLPYPSLSVMTIHDFLWDFISQFQKDLLSAVVKLVENEAIRVKDRSSFSFDPDVQSIVYREWRAIRKGIVSHDEVIALADHLFSGSKKLCDIFKDRYDAIFVDEYQDTFNGVLDILTTHLCKSTKNLSVGFFGDPMQSIFRQNEDKLERQIADSLLTKIVKEDNRRCPVEIVDCLNKIRIDGISQLVPNQKEAPNYQVKGNVTFLYGDNVEYNIDNVKRHEAFNNFDYGNPSENKELYLVHNLIALKLGFETLISIYGGDKIIDYKDRVRKDFTKQGINNIDDVLFGELIDKYPVKPTAGQKEYIDAHREDFEVFRQLPYSVVKRIYMDKDQLIGERKTHTKGLPRGSRRDRLISHLFNIQECVYHYKKSNFGAFLRKTKFKIYRQEHKVHLKNAMDRLVNEEGLTIENAIEIANDSGIWLLDDPVEQFIAKNPYLYHRIRNIRFDEIASLFNYVEDYTHYSTQHNIKGAEYDNVFVVLDNGKWSQYNFNYLFEGRTDKEKIVNRTRNLFYVCCSRAKKNLVIYFNQPSDKSIVKAIEWFGEENVLKI